MRILDKHLLRSFLGPVIYCLIGFSMMFIIFDLFGDAAKLMTAKVSFGQIALYYLCGLVPTLEFITPASLLLAALYTLWQLSKHSEIIAIRASGISFTRIFLPFLAVGFFFSIANGLVKEFLSPTAQEWNHAINDTIKNRERVHVHRNVAYYNTRDRRLWMVDSFDSDRPRVLTGVKITEERSDGSRVREITAAEAKFLDEQWWLFDTSIRIYDEKDNPIGQPAPASPYQQTGVEMADFTEKPMDFLTEVRSWELLSSHQMWEYLRRHPGLAAETLARRTTELHSRLAMPWACLIVTLFAVPAGVSTGRQSALIGVFKAVAFFLLFYAVTQLGMFLGMRRVLPPWVGAWLPNLVFLVAGSVSAIRMR